MKDLAVRMAADAAGVKNYAVTDIIVCAGLYKISLQTDHSNYECYVDVMNGDVPGMDATPLNVVKVA